MFVGVTFQSNDGLNDFLPPSFTSAQLHVKKDQFPEACETRPCWMEEKLSVPFAHHAASCKDLGQTEG